MKEQLKQYIDSVFASAADTQKNRELKEEIYADLCDKYDARIAEGAAPHEAYRRTVAGVGDLSELLGNMEKKDTSHEEKGDGNSGSYKYRSETAETPKQEDRVQMEPEERRKSFELIRSLILAFAIALYILSPLPTIIIGTPWSAAFLFIMVGLATGMIISMPIFRIHTVSAEVSEGDRRKLLFDYRMAKLMLAGAVMGYILCTCPAIISGDDAIGAVGLLLMVALSTAAIIVRRSIYREGLEKIAVEAEPDELFGDRSKKARQDAKKEAKAKGEKKEVPMGDKIMGVITGIYWVAVLVLYLTMSIYTGKWSMSWIIFVLAGFIIGIVHGVYSLIVGRGTAGPIVKIVICSILLFSMIPMGQWLFGATENIGFFDLTDIGFFKSNIYDDEDYEYGNAEIDGVDSLSELSINWERGNVKVSVYEGDTLIIRETMPDGSDGDRDRLRYRLSGGRLDICEYSPRFVLIGTGGPEKELEVLLPAALELKDVRISAVSAPVEISGINAKTLRIDTVSGGVSAVGCTVNGADVDNVSGKMVFKEFSVSEIDLDTVSGSMVLSLNGNIDSVEIDGVSGDVELYLPEDVEGFDVDFDGVSGRFRSEFSPMDSGDEYGNGEIDINVDTVSGDLTILPQTE